MHELLWAYLFFFVLFSLLTRRVCIRRHNYVAVKVKIESQTKDLDVMLVGRIWKRN